MPLPPRSWPGSWGVPRAVLELRRAGVDSLTDVLSILNDAASWLGSREIDQWPGQFDEDQVRATIEQGHTWLALLDGEAVGTLAVTWSDALWGWRSDDAGYVHRLAVRRSSSGLGLRLLDWASEAARQRGRDFLRLDCVETNSRLRRYYEAAGFEHCGEVSVQYMEPPGRAGVSTRRHSLYQRKLDTSAARWASDSRRT